MDSFCRVEIILIICISLVVISSGMVVDEVTWSKNKDWVIANGADSCIITLEIKNNTNVNMDGYKVDFTVNNSIFGNLNPITSYTVNNKTSTTFRTKYKSGTAIINGTVYYRENDSDLNAPLKSRTWSTEINIDHDSPLQMISYFVPNEATVGSLIPITIKYVDRWGNPIDNRRNPERVYFYASASNGTPTFENTIPHGSAANIENDVTGNFTAWLRITTLPVINIVQVHPFDGLLSDKYFFIEAIANAPPVSIEQYFDPEGYLGNPPKQYADGISLFQIIYTLKDQYGN